MKRQKDLPKEEIIFLYTQEMLSTLNIAIKYNTTATTINRLLKNNGIRIRTATEHLLTNKNPTKGKGHTEEAKEKIRKKAINRFSNIEERIKTSQKQIEYLSKVGTNKISKIENIIALILDKHEIYYQRQHGLREPETGRFYACADFFIEQGRKVIEVNGTYWHCDPRIYKNGPTYDAQIKTLECYVRKTEKYKKYNVSYIEIWEEDIRNDITEVERKILKFIKDEF